MTIEEGLKIAGYNEVEIAHLKSYHEGYRKGWENAMDAAKRITNVEYSTEYQEGTCKVENRPKDERTTDKGMFIPESPNEAETGGKWEGLDNLRKNVDELFYRVGNLERKLYD